MKRRILILLSLMISAAVALAESVSADDEQHHFQTRDRIGKLLGEAAELTRESTPSALDSSFFLLQIADSLCMSDLGNRDTLKIAILLNKQSQFSATSNWELSLAVAMEAHNLVEAYHSDKRRLRMQTLGGLASAQLEVSDFVNAISTYRTLIDFVNQSESKSEYEMNVLINALGSINVARLQAGDPSEELLEDVMSRLHLIEQYYGKNHWQYAKAYAHVGYYLKYMKRPEEAAPYSLRGDSLIKLVHPPEHTRSTWSSVMASEPLLARGQFQAVDSIVNSELAIIERTLQERHPYLPLVLCRKGQLLMARDSLEGAIEVFREVDRLYQSQSSLPSMLTFIGPRWICLAALHSGASPVYSQAAEELIEIKRSYLYNSFRYASDAQKLSLVKRFAVIESLVFSLAMQNQKAEQTELTAETVLNGKGLTFDAMAAQRSAAVCSDDPSLNRYLREHNDISSRMIGLALSDDPANRGIFSELSARKVRLEEQVSTICAELKLTPLPERCRTEDVISRLPDNSIYLDYVKYESYDHDDYYPYPDDSVYGVISYSPSGKVTLTVLGSAVSIDSLVLEYHNQMEMTRTETVVSAEDHRNSKLSEVCLKLYEILLSKMDEELDIVDRVYVSGDGTLNLLPFETLTGNDGRYLIEDYEFVYLSSGRDLLKEQTNSATQNAIVIADPDFMSEAAQLFAVSETLPGFSTRGSPECLASMFASLPNSGNEGQTISNLLARSVDSRVDYHYASEASESRLKAMDSPPSILHIATHGYYCDQTDNSSLSNPLLRSGLILAGANQIIAGTNTNEVAHDDGILTALEASGLNLLGTQLVVLSACQTGVGDVQSGEGVFGLRRAFQHAGARSIIMSLFEIPDDATVTLMTSFYERWLSGESKSSALRNASLDILNRRRASGQSTHPVFWGGFILAGDPE